MFRRKVNYYECDGMGITHHSNYIRYMEEARIDFMDKAGLSLVSLEADGIVSPVVDLQCRYLKPTRFAQTIDIDVRVSSASALKIKFEYTMKVGDAVVFTAVSTHCFLRDGHPVRLAEEYPAFFENIV